MSMMRNKGWSMALVGLAVLAVAGCSGSKVTTKSSAELPRYQIRTIALVPFTTLATPQMRDVVGQSFSAPSGARRSDVTIAVPPNTEEHLRQTVTVPAGAGGIVTQLLWSRLRTRQGVTVLAPSEAAKALAVSGNGPTPRRSVTGGDGGKTAHGGCLVDWPSNDIPGTSRWSLGR